MLASGLPIREHFVVDGVIMLVICMAMLQASCRMLSALSLKSCAMMCMRLLLLNLHTQMPMSYGQQLYL